jgi:hypothetical protein
MDVRSVAFAIAAVVGGMPPSSSWSCGCGGTTGSLGVTFMDWEQGQTLEQRQTG